MPSPNSLLLNLVTSKLTTNIDHYFAPKEMGHLNSVKAPLSTCASLSMCASLSLCASLFICASLYVCAYLVMASEMCS